MSDLLRAIAFAYRRKGVATMAGSELRLLLAYDLRWFAPEDAKRVVTRALETGALREEGDSLQPAFDVAAIDIPLNFRPGASILDEPVDVPAERPTKPAPPTPIDRAADDERRRRGLLISPEVARLIVRRRNGEDVRADAAAAEARALNAGAPPRA